MLGICIGALLAFIGSIVSSLWGGATIIGGITVSAGSGATVNTIMDAIGLGGISILLIGGGLLNKNIAQYVRAGMVVAGGFILYWAL